MILSIFRQRALAAIRELERVSCGSRVDGDGSQSSSELASELPSQDAAASAG